MTPTPPDAKPKPDPASADERWHLPQAIAAWFLPGLGHALLGERRRGGILGATILILWVAGLLIGGVSVVDHVQNKPWFFGQMLLAPSVAVDLIHQKIKQGSHYPPRPTDPHAPFEPSYGRVYEQGVLYTALAGLLNLLAVIDVIYRDPARHGRPASAAGARPASAGGSS